MKTTAENLITELIERTKQAINECETLNQKPLTDLNKKTNETSWSALECLEHLNLYGDFYLPEIAKRINESSWEPEANFKGGFLGNYFTNSMLPKADLKKMKTFKDKNPNGSKLDKNTIERFLNQQKEMLTLLNQARGISLNKTKTAISISKLIKLKLGDTFRFVIAHNERHLVQAKKAIN